MIVDLLVKENVAWWTPRTLESVESTPARELRRPGLDDAKNLMVCVKVIAPTAGHIHENAVD